ncbi:hypothetical protein QE152_g23292 [Popillia japonica]|uniref:Uncharacterized protein n=1 Tax=Popillia japonica TaxID=7064 RepID=A0AAW1KHU0_POPJA
MVIIHIEERIEEVIRKFSMEYTVTFCSCLGVFGVAYWRVVHHQGVMIHTHKDKMPKKTVEIKSVKRSATTNNNHITIQVVNVGGTTIRKPSTQLVKKKPATKKSTAAAVQKKKIKTPVKKVPTASASKISIKSTSNRSSSSYKASSSSKTSSRKIVVKT